MGYGVSFLPGRWKRQPQGPVAVDWGNPLARGLVDVWIGSQPDQTLVRKYATSLTAERSVRQQDRVGAFSSAAQRRIAIGVADNLFPDNQTATIALVKYNDDTTTRDHATFGYSDVAGTNRVSANSPWSNGSHYWDFGNYTTGRLEYAGDTKTVGRQSWVYTAGLKFGRTIYKNGVLGASNVNTLIRSSSTDIFYIGNYGANDSLNNDNIGISVFLILSVEWGSSEIRAFNENPWQLFRARRPIIYSFPSATIPTLSSATVVNVSTTGATPQVYVDFP